MNEDCCHCDIRASYEDLKWSYSRLRDERNDLMSRLNSSESALYDAEWKIKEELNPRIEQEKRAYDCWVTSPGRGDECFANGESGNCGKDCSIFCERDECLENFSPEEVIAIYKEGYDQVEGWLLENGYRRVVKKEALLILLGNYRDYTKKAFQCIIMLIKKLLEKR